MTRSYEMCDLCHGFYLLCSIFRNKINIILVSIDRTDVERCPRSYHADMGPLGDSRRVYRVDPQNPSEIFAPFDDVKARMQSL